MKKKKDKTKIIFTKRARNDHSDANIIVYIAYFNGN